MTSKSSGQTCISDPFGGCMHRRLKCLLIGPLPEGHIKVSYDKKLQQQWVIPIGGWSSLSKLTKNLLKSEKWMILQIYQQIFWKRPSYLPIKGQNSYFFQNVQIPSPSKPKPSQKGQTAWSQRTGLLIGFHTQMSLRSSPTEELENFTQRRAESPVIEDLKHFQ